MPTQCSPTNPCKKSNECCTNEYNFRTRKLDNFCRNVHTDRTKCLYNCNRKVTPNNCLGSNKCGAAYSNRSCPGSACCLNHGNCSTDSYLCGKYCDKNFSEANCP
jgi:hypothetical protein